MARPKIFIIGFNKCGTKTLHSFFEANGLSSAHHMVRDRLRRKRFLAHQIETNIEAGRMALKGIDGHDVYSDLVYLTQHRAIEAIKYFETLHAQYPSAYFIFNDRPIDAWVASRLRHKGGPYGDFAARYASALQVDAEDIPAIWAQQYAHHRQAVLEHFGAGDRFLHFPLLEKGPEDLCDFLKPDFSLDPAHWAPRGDQAERARQKAKAAGE